MIKKIHIVADENIPALDELLGEVAEISYLPGRAMQAKDIEHADALLVRSVTKVNEKLLRNSNVKFVGTCTIGTDHIDNAYLAERDIGFASAPGCNAAAVVDYVLAAMLYIYPDCKTLKNKVVGIIGCGEVGGRLASRLSQLGISYKVCDPFKPEGVASLDEILECDIISLHVPYTVDVVHATHHLLGSKELAKITQGGLLINTSRGAVIDNKALYAVIQQSSFFTVLDVYEDEPAPDIALLDAVDIATAHIAGYSLHGKIRGSLQIVKSLFYFFNIEKVIPDLLSQHKKCIVLNADDGVKQLVNAAYDIKEDSRRFVACMKDAKEHHNMAEAFDAYRKNYPVRYEWSFIDVVNGDALINEVKQLGFKK
jgi:erythronate-4-phosphate dehydrogenase